MEINVFGSKLRFHKYWKYCTQDVRITLKALSWCQRWGTQGDNAYMQSTMLHPAVHEQFRVDFFFIINVKSGWDVGTWAADYASGKQWMWEMSGRGFKCRYPHAQCRMTENHTPDTLAGALGRVDILDAICVQHCPLLTSPAASWTPSLWLSPESVIISYDRSQFAGRKGWGDDDDVSCLQVFAKLLMRQPLLGCPCFFCHHSSSLGSFLSLNSSHALCSFVRKISGFFRLP